MHQLVLDLLPETPPSFDNFVVGANDEALTGLMAWLAPTCDESALLLWGETGSGKTHLLRASEGFYVDAQRDPALSSVNSDRFPDITFYAVDNVGALDANGQITLFNLFNYLRATGGRLLTTASLPPRQLPLREDLRTRLGSGLIYRLQALTDAEKAEAIAAQARERALKLSPEAINYLLRHAPRDLRRLSMLVVALDQYTL